MTVLATTYTGIIPSVYAGGFVSSLLGANASVSFPYNPNTPGFFTSSIWTYPVINGGPHNLPVINDPNSPYGTGPNAYEAGAGPQDPFSLYGSGRNLQTAAAVGFVVTLGIYLISTAGLIEERRLKVWLRKRRF